MPDEATSPVDYRALCDALGWPPIAGGSPEADLEDAPADTDTPDPAAPQEEGLPAPESEGTDTPDTADYQKRYEDLHPQLTRAQEQNAEFRRLFEAAQQGDPDARAQLGLADEDEDEDWDEYDDPVERLQAELAELKDTLSGQTRQQQEAEARQQEVNYIHEELESLESGAEHQLSDDAVDFVVDRACMERDDVSGNPGVKGAYQKFNSLLKAEVERYLESKKNAPKAPVGGPGEETIDLTDDEARQQAMVRDMESEVGPD